ncbi:sigma-70 family RNA polymerase sigma factor [Candidatus Poribacteria bacterium]|nr:sigma-70 family RNA polymerase sigma factor [Candidatus Poribacteria bacterium]
MRTEDGYIIHKCLNGEKEAFGFLVDKYRGSIYAFAYFKLRNFHDAEDITQEVFLKAFRKLHTLRQRDNFLAWLYAITSNLCKNFLRSKFNRPDREFIADQSSEFFRYKSMNSYREESTHESLYEALDSLPEMHRQVLTLHYLGGMSCQEIARFLGTSPSNIKQRLSRARAKLKKEMLDMMSKTYDQHKLQPGFTFRIVELVKQIKIQPAPRSTPLLPFGLSAATGIVLTVLMFSPHLLLLTPLGTLLGSPLPGETKVMEEGELPVDVLEISEITFLSSGQGDGNDGAKKLPNQQNAFAPPLAPSGREGTWTKRADMPTARALFATAVVDGEIYAIGGLANWAILSAVEVYDAKTDTWEKKANMPNARCNLSAAVVNGEIYVVGGETALGVPTKIVAVYNPKTDTWTRKADFPIAATNLGIGVVNGKIYTVGGWSPTNCHTRWQNLCHRRDVGLLRPGPGCSNGGNVRPWRFNSGFATGQAFHNVGTYES